MFRNRVESFRIRSFLPRINHLLLNRYYSHAAEASVDASMQPALQLAQGSIGIKTILAMLTLLTILSYWTICQFILRSSQHGISSSSIFYGVLITGVEVPSLGCRLNSFRSAPSSAFPN